MKKIICPQCFAEFDDDKVHFRSERISSPDAEILPEEYDDDIVKFRNSYNGPDGDEIERRYEANQFFLPQEDDLYESYWNGLEKTEYADSKQNYKPWERKVIDPSNTEHQRYLEKQEEDFFIRDNEGMVSQIELKADASLHWMRMRCTRRVCPKCHNPLPINYGKYPVKFVSVIGVKGSGKTIYLSQLLNRLSTDLAAQIGLTALITSPDVIKFIRRNKIEKGLKVPDPTPVKEKQQPLFYQIRRPNLAMRGKMIEETMVLYDVPGEVFDPENEGITYFNNYAPYVIKADAYMLLIDPSQANCGAEGAAGTALNAIYNQLGVQEGEICEKPLAICISKSDSEAMSVMMGGNQTIINMVREPVTASDLQFNAKGYNPIAKELTHFFRTRDANHFDNFVKNMFCNYNYFAFSALDCGVVEEDGEQRVAGRPKPKRIEEPLYWIFKQLGYIGTNELIYGDIDNRCPKCDGKDYEIINDTIQNEVILPKTILGRRIGERRETIQVQVNRKCLNPECNYKWNWTGGKQE